MFINFYTSWCAYCRKMDQAVYTNPEVVKVLNQEYYAVRMDAESTDSIHFDGGVFVNREEPKKRRGFHELALLLGQRNGQFAPPTMLLLDTNFTVINRHFEYMDSKKLLDFLNQ